MLDGSSRVRCLHGRFVPLPFLSVYHLTMTKRLACPAPPKIILQAAEIGIEHNLGLTCDPIDGLVQVPCIVCHSPLLIISTPQPALNHFVIWPTQERNSLGAVKAVTAAQLAMATDAVHSVTLDEAIEAMRLTAAGV